LWKLDEAAGSETLQIGEERLPDIATQGDVGEFPVAFDGDEAGGFELFHVVGESGGADGQAFAERGAGGAFGALTEALNNFKAAGVGESLEDGESL